MTNAMEDIMQCQKLNLFDPSTERRFPILIYLPDNAQLHKEKFKTVIFGNGFQDQESLKTSGKFHCENYTYLAEFFTKRNYAFVSIQFEIEGDADSLDNLDLTNKTQAEARNHLWVKDEKIVLFVLDELKNMDLNLDLEKFIIGGHSNGGDVAKYFTNHHPHMVSCAIILDGRRCPIKENIDAKFLMFEAEDTSTDIGVLPSEGTSDHNQRKHMEWVIVKPKGSFHLSYTNRITKKDETQYYNPRLLSKIYSVIGWFLDEFIQ